MAKKFMNTEKMPVLFLGHGSPMNAIEENEFVESWRTLGKEIQKPNAILCVSAHWETSGTYVTAMEKPATIHDFGGFPQELFDVEYPAPGNPELAKEIKSILKRTEAGLDQRWGLDHGCWSVMSRLYPDANVPIVQLSLNDHQTLHDHYELAKELAPLRKKGILIVGSGNIVHNLRLIAWDKLDATAYGHDWAIEANEQLKKYILNEEYQQLFNYQAQGKAINLAIPTPEHFIPLLYALALKEEHETVRLFNDKLVAGSLAMTSLIIDNE
jgi:4,5-DOPA dioxygenase extradiol